MPRILVRESRAQRDLSDQVDRYLDDELFDTAERFVDAYEHFCARVSGHPEIAGLYETAEAPLRELGLRVWPLQSFPHLVFYYLTPTEIRIFAIVHGARDLEAALIE